MSPDLVNGLFEAGGAICIWMNVRRLWLDREVKGVASATVWFFWSWGVWNLFYYPSLDQWLSFWAGAVLQSGNFAWLALLLWIKYKRKYHPLWNEGVPEYVGNHRTRQPYDYWSENLE